MKYLQIRANSAQSAQRANLLYFAYGANLSTERYVKYRMNVHPVGVAKLENHVLKFSFPCEYLGKGYGNVERCAGQTVWGFLYRMDRSALLMLDIIEWAVLNQYRRVKLPVVVAGKTVEAFVYEARYPKDGLVPSVPYHSLILSAARSMQFPQEYLKQLEAVVPKEEFALDPGFSLMFPNRRRFAEKTFSRSYLWHDKLREKIATRLQY